jgi:hypothetical protein
MRGSGKQTEATVRVSTASMVAHQLPDPAVRLGEWLVRRELINRRDLYVALDLSYQREMRLGDALVSLGVLQRLRVESEAQALGVARLPNGRVRSRTPPPLPVDALGEPQTRDDTAVNIKVPPAPVHDLDGALPDSEERLCLSTPLAIPVEVPHIPALEQDATVPEVAAPDLTEPYATEQEATVPEVFVVPEPAAARPLAPLYLELEDDWD